MKENFKDIPGYEGLYQVSDLGNVKSLKFKGGSNARLLKPLNITRYHFVNLKKDGKQKTVSIHSLVACTFLNHCRKSGLVVDHIDNNPLNNKLENLQIISKRLNVHKDRKQLYSKHAGVSFSKHNKKYISQIYFEKKLYFLGYYKSEKVAAAVYQYNLLNLLDEHKRKNFKLLKRTRKISNRKK